MTTGAYIASAIVGALPNRKGPFPARQAVPPNRRNPVDVRLGGRPDGKTPIAEAQIRRQRGAQRGETGMHFPGNRPAPRTRHFFTRQHLRRGKQLVQIFGDRQRIPDRNLAINQARHQIEEVRISNSSRARASSGETFSSTKSIPKAWPTNTRATTRRSNFCC